MIMASQETPEDTNVTESVYNTVAGRILITDILAKSHPRPIQPHDYQRRNIRKTHHYLNLLKTYLNTYLSRFK